MMEKYAFLWLTLRFMKIQKLKSGSIFGCILFSSILLHVFCGFGCYFWKQVHGEKASTSSYGSGQTVLIALAAVLVMLVFSCSAVLIRNMFSLTFAQRWKSLGRLIVLGASEKDILFMATVETGLFIVLAVPAGCVISFFVGRLLGFWMEMPLGMAAGYLWNSFFHSTASCLRVFGELPFKKIACIFGKTENWARVTYHRAKLKIICEMEESNGKDIL